MIRNLNKPTDDTKIWRYFSLDKFIYMLLRKELVFTRSSNATDKLELRHLLKSFTEFETVNEKGKASFEHFLDMVRHDTYISCWTKKENESFLMWNTYVGKNQPGIAIVSSPRKIRESFTDSTGYSLHEVVYEDRFSDPEEAQSNVIITNTKSTPYSDEDEIRFSITDSHERINATLKASGRDDLCHPSQVAAGLIKVRIDPEVMIESLYFSPYTQDWQAEMITCLCRELSYTFEGRINKSNIQETN